MPTLKHHWAVTAAMAMIVAALSVSDTRAEALQWKFTIVAVGHENRLSDPALNVSAGNWQVAFTVIEHDPGTVLFLQPGVYVQTIGGALQRIATSFDPTPGRPGYGLCFFDDCTDTGNNFRVSLSEGNVAFFAQSRDLSSWQNAIGGLYVGNGVDPLTKILDDSTLVPGGGGRFFSFSEFGLAPSLRNGRIVFEAGSLTDHNAIYGDFGSGLVAIADTLTPRVVELGHLVFGTVRFTGFYAAPSVSPTYAGFDTVAFSASAQHGADLNLRGIWRYFSGPSGVRIESFADTEKVFPHDQTDLISPATDFGANVAFYADVRSASVTPTGIYNNTFSANVGQSAPGGGTFGSFGIFPSTDVSPREVGTTPQDHWVAFSANAGAYGDGIYLYSLRGNPSLTKVINAQSAMNLLTGPPLYLDLTRGDPGPAGLKLFHEAVKDGAVAFRLSMTGNDVIFFAQQVVNPNLTDVSSQVKVTSTGLLYSRVTHTYNGTMTVTNTSGHPIAGPLHVVLADLPAVWLVNPSGIASGPPYITLPSISTLNAGQSVSVPVRFNNPFNLQITFRPIIYSGVF